MALFKPLVGGRESLATTELHEGYVYFCDDGSLFFDYRDEYGVLQRKQINAKDAETLFGATLSHELTDSEFEIPSGAAVMQALTKYGVQSDWQQSDDTQSDYIKNKPTIATDDEIIKMLIDTDMFPVVTDSDGSILADENGDILLW